MILEIPEQNPSEKRKFSRIAFKRGISYQLKTPQGFGNCLASDIGESGIKISLGDFVPLGTEMMLQIQLGPHLTLPVLDLAGRVVWIARDPHTDRYQMGLEFVDTSSTVSSGRKIREYINSRDLKDFLAFSEKTQPIKPESA